MADYIKGYGIGYAPGTSDTAPTSFTMLENCIRSMPNLFPDPETIDVSTVDGLDPKTIPGPTAAEALGFTVAPNPTFLTAHAAMVSSQVDNEFFWMVIDVQNRNERYVFKATTVENLPTPEGNFGELDEVTWNIYAQSDKTKSTIPTP